MTRTSLMSLTMIGAMLLPAIADARPRDRGWNNPDVYYASYDENGRLRCDKGTEGLIIGGVAGGLLGNRVAGSGDRTVGTILGAGLGALAGRAIDRADSPSRNDPRCRRR
jgi:hypothetical protein